MPEKKRSFWTSLPGLVTGVAAIITTITVLYLAIVRPPDKPPIEEGVYTIQQKSNRRYLDAYLDATEGYNAVTREQQNHDSQRWILTSSEDGTYYTIQQKSNYRYLDTGLDAKNYDVSTREPQNGDTQRWIIKPS